MVDRSGANTAHCGASPWLSNSFNTKPTSSVQAAILPSLGQWTFESILELPSSRLQEIPWLVLPSCLGSMIPG